MLIKLLQKFSEEKQSRGERLTIPEAILLAQFVDWAEREAAEHSVQPDGLERVALHCICPTDADHPDCPVHGTSRR